MSGNGRSRNSRKAHLPLRLISGLVAFLLGILGNLVAAWIQNDILRDAFTAQRVFLILGLSGLGIFIGIWLENRNLIESRQQNSNTPSPEGYTPKSSHWQDIFGLKSKIQGRGWGIGVKRLFLIGSTFNVETDEEKKSVDD